MIQYKTGNLLESEAEALVNTVNTVGVMGKGIALQFKNAFPQNFRVYATACKKNELNIGQLLITEEHTLNGTKIIINFPTKTDWRQPSDYGYIEKGLAALVHTIRERNIRSIALPPLGAGNGGLEWSRVRLLIEKYLGELPCEVQVYEPGAAVREALKKERVKLTPARAMLLSVLYDLVHQGEFVSEFAAEKVAYFLQRFGAKDAFRLDFQPNFYGPYSGKVKHVLYYLNGSYLTGYISKDTKPFEELSIIADGEETVNAFLEKPEHAAYKTIAERTKAFLSGLYSSFALELLSTVDYLMQEKQLQTVEEIMAALEQWSDRKRTLFNDRRFVEITLSTIQEHLAPVSNTTI